MVEMPRAQVIGRVAERKRLEAVVDHSLTGAVTVLSGEPGAGKTTLLDEVAARSERRVLRACGVESEAVLPFSAVADLLIDLHADFAALPPVQREALEVSLSLRAGPSAGPLAVCTAALGVLGAVGEREPLLLIVDDFSWIDAPSQQILLFVARRLGPERIAMVLAVREELSVDPGVLQLPHIQLAPLSRDEGRELVAALSCTASAAAVESVLERCEGNPLAIVETVRSAGPDLALQQDRDRPLLPSSLRRTWSAALQALPQATLEAMAVLAMGRSAHRGDLEPVLAEIDLTPDDLLPAVTRRLVHEEEERLTLRHGLLRPMVRARTPVALRRRILRALARHADEELAVWYLAEAADGSDDLLAARLVDVALAARARSGYLAAARAWARAADLTGDPELRAERLLTAATDAHAGGGMSSALAWCDMALTLRADPMFAADVAIVRSRAHTWIGAPAQAVDDAVTAADAVRDHDAGRAAQLYSEAVFPSGMMGRVGQMVEIAERAIEINEPLGEAPLLMPACASAAYALAGDVVRARRLFDDLELRAPNADPLWDSQALAILAQTAVFLERVDVGRRMCGPVIATARRLSAPVVLGFVLAVQAELDWWAGRWMSAYADASEGWRWADELGQGGNRAFVASFLARMDAVRGDTAACAEHVDEALRAAGTHGLECMKVYAAAALGTSALGQGDAATAAAHLDRARRLLGEMGNASLTAVPFAGDLVEAHVRLGDVTAAREAVGWVAERAETAGSAYSRVIAARGRGLLAENIDEAEGCFASAYDAHNRLTAPYEHARTLLAHGEVRRRWRRPGAARPLLLEAQAAFVALGARPWIERADAELAATGFRSKPVSDDGDAGFRRLTPQEFQIARSVAEGLSNVEVAAALFVSRKTVEAHLTRVYRKLGVRSRTELVTMFSRRRDFPSTPIRIASTG